MTSDDREASPTPEWAWSVQPGTIDRGVFDQAEIWLTGQATVVRIMAMSEPHLRAVVGMLTSRAEEHYTAAVLDALFGVVLADLSGEVAGERLAQELTGLSIADLDPIAWLETTALMRALRRELAARVQG